MFYIATILSSGDFRRCGWGRGFLLGLWAFLFLNTYWCLVVICMLLPISILLSFFKYILCRLVLASWKLANHLYLDNFFILT